jgi:para-aminobenzoate synthetase component 1
MDRLGAAGRPFVFAMDFEKTEALLVPDPFSSRELFFSVRGRGNGLPDETFSAPVPGRPAVSREASGQVERDGRVAGASGPVRHGTVPSVPARPDPVPSVPVGPGPVPAVPAWSGLVPAGAEPACPLLADPETLVPEPMSYEEYSRGFGVVRRGLLRGDSYLVNLTARTPVTCGLDLAGIYRRAGAMYRLFVPGRFTCFSPEIFVRIEDGVISTFPMKGTIDASVPDAEARILADPKEAAEHATVVDLLRNDLSIFAREVHVRRWRYVDRIRAREREILQVSSEVAGRLPRGWEGRVGEIMLGLTPAGSCSGAPKESTLRIIREAEGVPRGYYTGVFGLFDGKSLDTGVLIRFVEEEGGRLFFRSGGGITAMSRPRDEYREVLEKICLPLPDARSSEASGAGCRLADFRAPEAGLAASGGNGGRAVFGTGEGAGAGTGAWAGDGAGPRTGDGSCAGTGAGAGTGSWAGEGSGARTGDGYGAGTGAGVGTGTLAGEGSGARTGDGTGPGTGAWASEGSGARTGDRIAPGTGAWASEVEGARTGDRIGTGTGAWASEVEGARTGDRIGTGTGAWASEGEGARTGGRHGAGAGPGGGTADASRRHPAEPGGS